MEAIRIGPRESGGVLLGLRLAQLVALALCLLTVVVFVRIDGAPAKLVGIGIVGLLMAAAFLPVKGRTLDQFLPVLANFAMQRFMGEDTYRGGVFRVGETGETQNLSLPGDLAHLELRVFAHTGGQQIGAIRDPREKTLTAVIACEGSNFPLASTTVQGANVDMFGTLLTQLCQETSPLKRIQVLERTEPDSGESIMRDWIRRGVHDGSPADLNMAQLLTAVSVMQLRHELFVAVVLDTTRAAAEIRDAGGGVDGGMAVLFREVAKVSDGLTSAGVTVLGWCPPRQLGYIIRTGYDPAARTFVDHRGGAELDDRGGDEGLPSGVDPRIAGPTRGENEFSYYRTDSAVHRSWWILEWPRQWVSPGFLMPLLLTSSCRRTLSLVFEPVRGRKARTKMESLINNQDSEHKLRGRTGRRTTRRQRVEAEDSERRERELVDGAGLYRMIGFITTSATADGKGDELAVLEAQSAEVERLANASHLEVARLYGEHDQGFAAGALPLGRGLR